MRHIEPSRLFAYAEEQTELHPTEREHLATCADCEQVLKVFEAYLMNAVKREKGSKHAPEVHG